MAGPRQPIDLIEYKGRSHLTKQQIKDRRDTEVKANNDKVAPPDILDGEQCERFNEIADELLDIGIMTNLDNDSLARFIIHQSEYEKVARKIYETSIINIEDYEDLVKIQEKHFKMARQSEMDLGLTISSRAKLVAPKKEDDKPINKFDKFKK